MNDNFPRLIEHAFPLKQASLDSVHEKNVRHGHISTLHIWPARRPLAACRAALIATLLPDPGTQEKRQELCERIGGKLVKKIERKKMPNGSTVEREKEETEGGILRWIGSEPSQRSGKQWKEWKDKNDLFQSELEWFRQEIRKAYGGRAPKVLDPFAGGGAIPLEAMRLGCEATAVDINPVAWFILKCTLEYPQKLAGKTHPLPEFILENEEFMEAFYKAHPHLAGRTKKTRKQVEADEGMFPQMVREDSGRIPKADLAWHVRAWGQWVLEQARRELAQFYPTYADFMPLDTKNAKPFEKQPMQLVPLKSDGTPDIDALNKEFSKEYLANKGNPRWVAKPTVAYLWARTVTCKNCRATIPLLKTLWLCKKDNKRVVLTLDVISGASVPLVKQGNRDGCPTIVFGIDANVPAQGGNAAQKREHDKRLGAGTMSRSGAKCPCCGTIMTMEDIRLEGKANRLGSVMTAVIVDGLKGKEYRLPTETEISAIEGTELAERVAEVFAELPFGLLEEPIVEDAKRNTWCVQYGVDQFNKLFTKRQILALGTFVKWSRKLRKNLENHFYSDQWSEAIRAYMAICNDRLADAGSTICHWQTGNEFNVNTFQRFALPISWDYSEVNFCAGSSGSHGNALDWVCRYIHHSLEATVSSNNVLISQHSATAVAGNEFDAIVTDPPYYDAIGYSVLMDFFYVWLRRSLNGLGVEFDKVFEPPLSPKWNHDTNDGELVDDSSRHNGDRVKSRQAYEDGMARVFQVCHAALKSEGRLVIVFAHKHPDAWETLVSAIIRSGFVVGGSWPIMTERVVRTRSLSSAALSSSVWLTCKKRPVTARPGWDNLVLEEMRTNIQIKLREFWDAGIRGPDFVWAATGPAMEAYSRHPVVKKANEPGPMTVGEFLTHVRRIVVDFVVGRVLSGEEGETDSAAADRLDEPTAYYLLHRHDFGMDEAPAGACILYAVSCGLSDRELAQTWDLIHFTKATENTEDTEDEDSDLSGDSVSSVAEDSSSGSKVKLRTWAQRKGKSLGYEAPGGKPVPLIDRAHRLMHLWKAGDLAKVDAYLDDNGLRRAELFKRLLQSIIELSPRGSEERSLLESISNHVGVRGAVRDDAQMKLL